MVLPPRAQWAPLLSIWVASLWPVRLQMSSASHRSNIQPWKSSFLASVVQRNNSHRWKRGLLPGAFVSPPTMDTLLRVMTPKWLPASSDIPQYDLLDRHALTCRLQTCRNTGWTHARPTQVFRLTCVDVCSYTCASAYGEVLERRCKKRLKTKRREGEERTEQINRWCCYTGYYHE